MTKTQCRQLIKQKLKTLSPETRDAKSRLIADRLFSLEQWKASTCLFCYMSMSHEVRTDSIIVKALDSGKKVFVPRVAGENLFFHEIKNIGDANVLHPYGVLEPPPTLPEFPGLVQKNERMLLIVPGIAFDEDNHRLGRGKGCYDRFIHGITGVCRRSAYFLIGICFHLQLCRLIPFNERDISMDMVLSEKVSSGDAACPV